MDQNLTIIIVSFGVFVLGLTRWEKLSYLNKIGTVTKGIIFRNNYKSGFNESGTYYPVVRFLTADKTWITKELDIGSSPPMEQGKKVSLIYDPKNPYNVTFYSFLNLKVAPIGITLVGISGIVYGLIKYLDIL